MQASVLMQPEQYNSQSRSPSFPSLAERMSLALIDAHHPVEELVLEAPKRATGEDPVRLYRLKLAMWALFSIKYEGPALGSEDLPRAVEAFGRYLGDESERPFVDVLGVEPAKLKIPDQPPSIRSLVDKIWPPRTDKIRGEQSTLANRLRTFFIKAKAQAAKGEDEEVGPLGYLRAAGRGTWNLEEQDQLELLYDLAKALEPHGIKMEVERDRLGMASPWVRKPSP